MLESWTSLSVAPRLQYGEQWTVVLTVAAGLLSRSVKGRNVRKIKRGSCLESEEEEEEEQQQQQQHQQQHSSTLSLSGWM